jgi:hypothetical protein
MTLMAEIDPSYSRGGDVTKAGRPVPRATGKVAPETERRLPAIEGGTAKS